MNKEEFEARMTEGSRTGRERRMQKRREKKEKAKKWRIGLLCVALVAAVAVIVGVMTSGVKGYEDAKSFKKYATYYFSQLEKKQGQDEAGAQKTQTMELKYGTPISTAVQCPKLVDPKINQQVQTLLSDKKKTFAKRSIVASKGDTLALMVQGKVFQSSKQTIGLALDVSEQEEQGKGMQTTDSKVETYNFSAETGMPVTAGQVFKGNYAEVCSKYLTQYFKENRKGDLSETTYTKALAPKEANFSNFILANTGIRFYFAPGTVLKKEEGNAYGDIPYSALTKVAYDKPLIRRIDPNKPMVALTYDDGPSAKVSDQILNCLQKYGALATFFELGQNVKEHPKVVAHAAKLGMEIGNHSWSHKNLKVVSKKEVKAQIQKTNQAIIKATGKKATVFRPPYGNNSATVEKYADAPIILWSVDTLDWKSRNAKSVINSVKGVHDLDGRVILMHSLYPSTARATEKLVPWLQKKGYQLVTVSELLQYRFKETPKPGKFYGYGYFYAENANKKK